MEMNDSREGAVPNLPQFKLTPSMIPIAVLIFLFAAAGTLFYQVGPDEVGVVQRFGKYMRTTQPGLQMKLPFGIESVRNVKVTHVFTEEFGFRTVDAGVHSVFFGRDSYSQGQSNGGRRSVNADNPLLKESLMLTGDLNVAMVEWIVQYTVKDPVQFAFQIREPRETIRNMSEAVMRLVVGNHSINQVLTSGREEIQQQAKAKLQEILDSYGAGINIHDVFLQDVMPPNEVKPSFNEVNEARQEKEKVINQAWEEYNRIIPRAKGRAEQAIREAEGYKLERVNRAEGDAERFLLAWEAYRKAPAVTKRRLYLETMEQVLPELSDKLILDESQKGILPLLSLSQEKGGQKS